MIGADVNMRIACLLSLVTASAVFGACAASSPRPAAAPGAAGHAPRAHTQPPDYSILNLYDDFGRDRSGVGFDWGFSALVRYGGMTILFDAGTDDAVFRRNVAALGVDLRTVDVAILSHNHPDHTAGFDYLLEMNPSVRIYLPADPLLGGCYPFNPLGPDPGAREALPPEERYRPLSDGCAGFVSSGRFPGATVEYVGANREVAQGIHLIATRAEAQGYYSAYPPHEANPVRNGLPELSLSLSTAQGEVLVVGCSHSGVELIVRHAKSHLHRDIDLVMGGFHLLPYSADAIRETARRMHDELGVLRVAPTHCTGHIAFRLFREVYGEAYLFAGLGERITFAAPRSM